MIIDKLENLNFYQKMLPHLAEGLKALAALDSYEEGTYEFDGGFFKIQKGTTLPMAEGTFEAHRRYIDVQVLLEGSEDIAWAEIADLTPTTAYDSEKDITRYTGATTQTMHIATGMCYVAFQKDGHKAVRHLTSPQTFTKAIFKLPVGA